MTSLFNRKKRLQEQQEKQHLFDKVVEAERLKREQDEFHERERQNQRREKQHLEDMLERERKDGQMRAEIARRKIQEAEEKTAEMQRKADEVKAKVLEKKRTEMEHKMREEREKAARESKLASGTPETLRDLRELIRDKFELDVKIWGGRGARRPNRPIFEKKMEKADVIMEEILYMVGLWGDNSDNRWSEEEWERVELIRQKLNGGGHIVWATSPKPWEM